jgi:heavy metal sensor kinase
MFWRIGAKFFRRADIKMTLWYIFTIFVSFLIIGAFIYLRLDHKFIKEVDRFLLDEGEELAGVLSKDDHGVDSIKRFENEVAVRKYYPFFFRILNKTGDLVYSSRDFGKILYNLDGRVLVNAKNGKKTRENVRSSGRYRIITTPLPIGGKLTYIVQIGTNLKFAKKSLYNFGGNLLIIFPILLVSGSLGGWFLARKALSPIGYMVSTTRNITSTNLSDRLVPRGTGDELDELIRTINEMISGLEGSFKRMAEFTADASHELKTPICAMRGEIEGLLLQQSISEEHQEVFVRLIERFDYLNRMINDLILLSKFDTSQIELNIVPLRLDLLIKDLCDLFRVLAEQKNISLKMEILPEVMVIGDKMRLPQLFGNLIDNAIKYTYEGYIRVQLDKNGNYIRVKVSDTGIGISKEEQKNIFRRFYRVDKSRSRETGGVGLGLNIAEWIVQAHHGRIEVESELRQGSIFTVYLPVLETSECYLKAKPLAPKIKRS